MPVLMTVKDTSWCATVRSTLSVSGAPTYGVIAMPRSGACVNTGSVAVALETEPSGAWNVAVSPICPVTPAVAGLLGIRNSCAVCPGARVREVDGPAVGSSPFQTAQPCGQV